MTTIIQPICFDCEHFDVETCTCKAFSKGIPEKIWMGDNNHSKPLRGQKNAIVFEPKVKILQDTNPGSMLMDFITQVKEDLDNMPITFTFE